MQAFLKNQIGQNIQVYVDDIVVNTKESRALIDDLRETFDNLDQYKIKLNPEKCAFGVPSGQLLGYFISERGIEASPKKIKDILAMEKMKNVKGVQELAGEITALRKFISRMGKKDLPFYQLFHKYNKFKWMDKADEAFEDLKRLLSTSPIPVTPTERERAHAALHCCNAPNDQHDTCGRTTRGRQNPRGAAPAVLPQRGGDTNKAEVHSLPKAGIRYIHDHMSAMPLLPGASDSGC